MKGRPSPPHQSRTRLLITKKLDESHEKNLDEKKEELKEEQNEEVEPKK